MRSRNLNFITVHILQARFARNSKVQIINACPCQTEVHQFQHLLRYFHACVINIYAWTTTPSFSPLSFSFFETQVVVENESSEQRSIVSNTGATECRSNRVLTTKWNGSRPKLVILEGPHTQTQRKHHGNIKRNRKKVRYGSEWRTKITRLDSTDIPRWTITSSGAFKSTSHRIGWRSEERYQTYELQSHHRSIYMQAINCRFFYPKYVTECRRNFQFARLSLVHTLLTDIPKFQSPSCTRFFVQLTVRVKGRGKSVAIIERSHIDWCPVDWGLGLWVQNIQSSWISLGGDEVEVEVDYPTTLAPDNRLRAMPIRIKAKREMQNTSRLCVD